MSGPAHSAWSVYRRLLRQVLPYWRRFALIVAAHVVFALTEPAFAALMKPLLDGSFVERDPTLMRLVPLAMIVLFLVRGVSGYFSTFGTAWVGRRVVADLRAQMFERLLALPGHHFHKRRSGLLLARLTHYPEQIAHAATNTLTVLVRDSLSVLGLLAWMAWLNVWLTATFLLAGPPMVWSVWRLSQRLRALSRRAQESVGEIGHVVQEAIEAHRVIRIFGGQDAERRRFGAANEANRRRNLKVAATDALSSPLVQLIAAFGFAAIVWLATIEAQADRVSVGGFVSFVIAISMLLAPLKRLTGINGHVQRGIAAADGIFELLDERPEPDTGTGRIDRARGQVVFEGVTHRYADTARPALEAIDLEIGAGEKVALVGRSGAGKTTLVSLLMRFDEASAGVIRLDGTDIRALTLASLRRQIAYVGQEVVLFHATLAENIAYGRPGATRDAILAAARAAHVDEFLDRLPQGIDTPVGEKGLLLSGGQRQRVAIARALLKDAPILVLDEATAALDSQSEGHIQAAIEALTAARTTLVIAHRLSTIERADRIVVLDEGRIVETGTHAQLLARRGAYAALHRGHHAAASGPE